jgi:hypothetical protein
MDWSKTQDTETRLQAAQTRVEALHAEVSGLLELMQLAHFPLSYGETLLRAVKGRRAKRTLDRPGPQHPTRVVANEREPPA